jgi:site-specific DNA-cytosine methylase
MLTREITHAHLFCGLGGGAKGFNDAQPRVGNLVGKFRCLGGIDVDPAGIRDFERLTGVRGTVLDLFDRSQYIAFHGHEPPAGWREAGPADIVRAMGGERPNIWFLSAPCKGFSGLLNETKSKTDKYQALNRLTLRGIWLALEAYKDDPAEMIVFENVPRIAHRGRHLLDQIVDLLRHYGYAVAETTHDCGEIGGLAQSRKRFLLVARHIEKVPPFLYEPEKKRLQAVGTVLDRMPLPGDLRGGPMHRVPNLQWKTWVRLAFVEAGSDWRSLNKLEVQDGFLRDFLIAPDLHNTVLGVRKWDEHTGAVVGRSLPLNGAFSIADPRMHTGFEYSQYGVLRFDEHMGAVSGQSAPGGGKYTVADPRTGIKHNNCFRIVRFDQNAGTVTGGTGPSAGGQGVADPRSTTGFGGKGKYIVTPYDSNANTVISGSTTGQGAFAVADPRPNLNRAKGDNYLTAGHYGVVRYDDSCGAVSAAAGHDNGRWSVADPRLPEASDKLVAVIRSLDGTWHRPFTTLELAALQSLVDPEEQLELDGLSDSDWRERIGNAVPPKAAQAIAEVMGTTLLLAWSGETFVLSATPIWVRPVAVALSVAQGGAQ